MRAKRKLSPAQLAALAAIVKHGRASYTAAHLLYKHGFTERVPAVISTRDGVLNTRSVVALIPHGLITFARVPGQHNGVYRPTPAAYEMLSGTPPSAPSASPADGVNHATKKKSPTQLNREIASALAGRARASSADEGLYYLTDIKSQPLGSEFRSRPAAKRAAMHIVRDGAHSLVEVWHLWRGTHDMQGLANVDGWSDV